MTIRDAIDELGVRVTHEEMARALGVSVASVRQYRLSSNAQAHRSPAPGWQKALARLARQRGKELQALADRLDKG